MTTTIRLTHDYAAAPDKVWAVAIDWECWAESVRGLAKFRRLPDQPAHAGQKVTVDVSILGMGPWFPWTMEVVALDPESRIAQSHEHGGPVKRWDHRMTVQPIETGARLTDEIVIDAGWLTPLYASWARFLYAKRHKPRLKMLGLAPPRTRARLG